MGANANGDTRPLVSCLLPVYNGERWLDIAIQSVLDQTYSNLELIVIDDGSTDGSGSIAAKFASSDSRVTVINQDNAGIVDALNNGLNAARGMYIARMDADDISLPERFSQQVKALETNPQVAVVGTLAKTIGPDDGIDVRSEELVDQPVPLLMRSSKVHEFPPSLLQVLHPTIMVRADLLRRIGGYSGTYRHVEDYDLYMRLSAWGPIAELQQELLLYRLHGDNLSIRRLHEQEENAARCDLNNVNAFRREARKPEIRVSDKTLRGWTEFRYFRRELPLNRSKITTLGRAISYTAQGSRHTSPKITALILARCALYSLKYGKSALKRLRSKSPRRSLNA